MTKFDTSDETELDHEDATAQQFSDLSSAPGLDKEQPQVGESHDLSHDQAGEEKKQRLNSGVRTDGDNVELNNLNSSDKEEDGISTESVQQSMNNIFQLLKVENPHSSAEASPPIDFNEFTKMLTDPSLTKVGEGALTSTEKSLSLSEGPKSDEFVSLVPRSGEKRSSVSSVGAEENSEIVNATGAPTLAEHLKLLKEKIPPVESDKVPLLSELGVTDESIAESLAEQKKTEEEAPWPDIGQPDIEVKIVRDKEVVDETTASSLQQKQLQGQVNSSDGSAPLTGVGEGEAPVISGLVMPSADVGIDVVMQPGEESPDIPKQSLDQPEESQDQSEREVTPGPAEQEGERLEQEVGGDIMPTELVSKSKKKTRRGAKGKAKRTSTGNTTLGAAALVEVVR